MASQFFCELKVGSIYRSFWSIMGSQPGPRLQQHAWRLAAGRDWFGPMLGGEKVFNNGCSRRARSLPPLHSLNFGPYFLWCPQSDLPTSRPRGAFAERQPGLFLGSGSPVPKAGRGRPALESAARETARLPPIRSDAFILRHGAMECAASSRRFAGVANGFGVRRHFLTDSSSWHFLPAFHRSSSLPAIVGFAGWRWRRSSSPAFR
jgi:hypothetical protein